MTAPGRDGYDRATSQAKIQARPREQVAQTERDCLKLVCPDCGQRVGRTRGGHELPDGRRFHGWACEDCRNVFPATTDGPDAGTWNDRIVGIRVEFRDGKTRWVAGFASEGGD